VILKSALSPPAALPSVAPEPLIGLASMWRLRWGLLAVQLGALAVARELLHVPLAMPLLLGVVAITALSNLVLASWLTPERASTGKLAAALLLDVAIHTALLFGSGGSANPFSAFFVVHVAVAALLLGPLWAALLVLVTSLCFASLFLIPSAWLGPHALHMASPMHLQGMWAAYVLSACFVAYFVSVAVAALRKRERELSELSRFAASMERLASLTTLAAGAAHELATPLSSIAVSATELASALEASGGDPSLVAEARHVRREVARCREILDRLAADAGEHPGQAPVNTTFSELTAELRAELGPREVSRLDFIVDDPNHTFSSPRRGLVLALANLVKNAVESYAEGDTTGRVEVSMSASNDEVRFEVRDFGAGMSEEVQKRVGEPFFTTKPPGRGMGLGAYLVRSFARQVGGTLEYEAPPSGGTLAILSVPARASSAEVGS
jgi:two-component system sensor histidine kinase RegB